MLPAETQAKIVEIAKGSAIHRYAWRQRGYAPIGYTEGVGICFAHCLMDYRAGEAAAIEMAKAVTSNGRKDALAWYGAKFSVAKMSNAKAGEDTLRHLFVLMLGLGMRESSGTYCDGRDTSARNVSADTAERLARGKCHGIFAPEVR